jgi:hypothetical protein
MSLSRILLGWRIAMPLCMRKKNAWRKWNLRENKDFREKLLAQISCRTVLGRRGMPLT